MVKNIEEPTLVLYDKEEEYTLLMSDYLRSQRGIPWKIRSYTRGEDLLRLEKGNHISILLVAEASYTENFRELDFDKMVILNESGFVNDELTNVSKYQAAENVLHALLEVYLEFASDDRRLLQGDSETKFIGIYSPVKRSLQTSFALTMSELLADTTRALYISFEHYSGVADIMPGDMEMDLADLVYFLNADAEKFKLHFQSIVKERGRLSYIPPMKSGQNLLTVTPSEWRNLLKRISETGLFDVVIMDLTDSMQGLFDILHECKYVYTIMKDDRFAQGKMMQYEHLLQQYEYKDVIEKTIRLTMPKFKYIPDVLEQYTIGDFADYVRRVIVDLED